MQKNIFGLLLIALLAISCHPAKQKAMTNNSNLEMMTDDAIMETSWKLTTLEGKEVTASPNQQEDIHFVLRKDGKVTGYTGCNIFNGTYTLEKGNRIRFSKMASTRMACGDEAIKEFDFLQIFELADNYTINNNTLMLNVGKRAPLAVFTKNAMSTADITEKYWKLKTLNGQPVTMAKNQEREIYFMLKTDENRVTGFSGCNTFGGTYTLEKGNRIHFDQMLSTMRACPDVEVNESEFLKVFELADNYTINGDTLLLNVGRRAPLAVFEAVYF